MTKRPISPNQALLLLALFLFVSAPGLPLKTARAQQQNSAATSDFSKMNWDEEEESTGGESKAGGNGLSGVNWDEEGDSNEATGDGETGLASGSWEDDEGDEAEGADGGLQTLNQDEIDRLESRERQIHISGFFLFIGYIIGGILTAFITRKSKLAVSYPPELLIILHSVWPLELLLFLLVGRSRR